MDVSINTNPEINNLTSTDNNAGSDRWLVSRNYLCFKNLNISYTLPKKMDSKGQPFHCPFLILGREHTPLVGP